MSTTDFTTLAVLTALVLGAIVAMIRSTRHESVVPAEPHRLADGVVELVEIGALRRGSNARAPRIGPFQGLESGTPRPRRLVPSKRAPRLLGEVLLWQIFVGRDGKRWTDSEVAMAYEAAERAGIWIEKEAIRHDAPTNIRIASVYFAGIDDVEEEIEIGFQFNGEEIGPSEGNAEVRIIASAGSVAASHGFRSLVDLVEHVQATDPADVHVWLVHVRRRGQSFAVAPDLSPIPGLTLACCYLREAGFSEPLRKANLGADPVTIAHELLHLFGASDKYGRAIDSFPEASLTGRDIMRLDVERLSRLRIDPLTADEIGWNRGVGRAGRK